MGTTADQLSNESGCQGLTTGSSVCDHLETTSTHSFCRQKGVLVFRTLTRVSITACVLLLVQDGSISIISSLLSREVICEFPYPSGDCLGRVGRFPWQDKTEDARPDEAHSVPYNSTDSLALPVEFMLVFFTPALQHTFPWVNMAPLALYAGQRTCEDPQHVRPHSVARCLRLHSLLLP